MNILASVFLLLLMGLVMKALYSWANKSVSIIVYALVFTILAPLPYPWCFDDCAWVPAPLIVPGLEWIYFPQTLMFAGLYFVGLLAMFFVVRYFRRKKSPQLADGSFKSYLVSGFLFILLAVAVVYGGPLISKSYSEHKREVAEKSCNAATLNAKFTEASRDGYNVYDKPKPLSVETNQYIENTKLVYDSMRVGIYGFYDGDNGNGSIDDTSTVNYELTPAQKLAVSQAGESLTSPYFRFPMMFDKCTYGSFSANNDNQIFCFQKDVLKFKECWFSGSATPVLNIDDDFFIESLNAAGHVNR